MTSFWYRYGVSNLDLSRAPVDIRLIQDELLQNVGSVLLIDGEWKIDTKYGRQFAAEKWEETTAVPISLPFDILCLSISDGRFLWVQVRNYLCWYIAAQFSAAFSLPSSHSQRMSPLVKQIQFCHHTG